METGVDLIDVCRLETEFNVHYTEHRRSISDRVRRLRRVTEIKRWSRIKELGHGGFGTVWLEREQNGELRAVKEVRKQIHGTKAADYLRELLAMAYFSKEETCFVEFFGWYENDVSIFIAMEYLELGDLQHRVLGPMPENDSKSIIFQLAEGLNFMHQKHFTPRDLKPANIFVVSLSPTWWVKLADFGVSKRVHGDATALYTTIIGAYVAPEVYDLLDDVSVGESSEYTSAVDIWSLGCVMHWLLAAQTPFPTIKSLIRFTRTSVLSTQTLKDHKVSQQGIEFIQNLIVAKPQSRYTAERVLQSPWLQTVSVNTEDSSEAPESNRILQDQQSRQLILSQDIDTLIADKAGENLNWDQFANLSREKLYTTVVDRSHPEYAHRAREAERKVREIEGTSHEYGTDATRSQTIKNINPRDTGNRVINEASGSSVLIQDIQRHELPRLHDTSISSVARKDAIDSVYLADNQNRFNLQVDPPSSYLLANHVEQHPLRHSVVHNIGVEKIISTSPVSAQSISRKDSGGTIQKNPDSTVEPNLLEEFREFTKRALKDAQDARAARRSVDSAVTKRNLIEFSENFKLSTPIPQDILQILGKSSANPEPPIKIINSHRDLQQRQKGDYQLETPAALSHFSSIDHPVVDYTSYRQPHHSTEERIYPDYKSTMKHYQPQMTAGWQGALEGDEQNNNTDGSEQHEQGIHEARKPLSRGQKRARARARKKLNGQLS
ncbi:hypothetical protein MMC11_008037 [Xylographa trunciseda]|nr:hypothetical protein [Xylographa trunciseda]